MSAQLANLVYEPAQADRWSKTLDPRDDTPARGAPPGEVNERLDMPSRRCAPRPSFTITHCDLRAEASTSVSWNIKSPGSRRRPLPGGHALRTNATSLSRTYPQPW